jgi:hypothetical protein
MVEIEYTTQFGSWWDSLDEDEQISIEHYVRLLEAKGVALRHPILNSGQGIETQPNARTANTA